MLLCRRTQKSQVADSLLPMRKVGEQVLQVLLARRHAIDWMKRQRSWEQLTLMAQHQAWLPAKINKLRGYIPSDWTSFPSTTTANSVRFQFYKTCIVGCAIYNFCSVKNVCQRFWRSHLRTSSSEKHFHLVVCRHLIRCHATDFLQAVVASQQLKMAFVGSSILI